MTPTDFLLWVVSTFQSALLHYISIIERKIGHLSPSSIAGVS